MPEIAPLSVDWKDAAWLIGLRSESEAVDSLVGLGLHPSVSSQVPPEWISVSTGTRHYQSTARSEDLQGSLFTHRANLKLIISQVAMHLSPDERRSLFSAIDRLLNVAEWEDESSKIDEESFRSYLRFTTYAHPGRVPNLGVSPDGSLLAGWHREGKSIHVEFLPNDQCTALLRLTASRGPERIAWRGHVARLRDFITNNGAVDCID